MALRRSPTPRGGHALRRGRAPRGGRARGWLSGPVVAPALLALFAGTAQYSLTAIAGDVAAEFGRRDPTAATTPVGQVGMGLTTLGLGFAVIRLASLLSLPAAGVADRLGRRRTLVIAVAAGLSLTALAALAPSFALLVAALAVARPLLTAADAVAAVVAAEETQSADRAKAIALVGGAYSFGAGVISVTRGLVDPVLGFRGVLALVLVPLALLPLVARRVEEPSRFARDAAAGVRRRLGAVPRGLRARLALLCVVTFGFTLVVGPVFTYLFVYGEGVLGATAGGMGVVVALAGPVGLGGLLLGRWAADRLGRRATAALSLAAVAVAGSTAYSAGFVVLAAGYWGTLLAAGAYTPSGGAVDVEVFPTSVRATAAGWLAAAGVLGSVAGLVGFGLIAEAAGTFTVAGLVLCLPVALVAVLYRWVPETRGLELEESAPERG